MFRAIGLLGLAILSTGCATITRGTTEVLIIETEPVGADVQLAPSGLTCRTPCSLELKRKKDFVVDIKRDGYEPVTVSVLSQVVGAGAAGMAGNVLVGGLIGAGIDAMSGATKGLKPNPIKVTLVPITSADPTPGPTVAEATPVVTPIEPATTEAAEPASNITPVEQTDAPKASDAID